MNEEFKQNLRQEILKVKLELIKNPSPFLEQYYQQLYNLYLQRRQNLMQTK